MVNAALNKAFHHLCLEFREREERRKGWYRIQARRRQTMTATLRPIWANLEEPGIRSKLAPFAWAVQRKTVRFHDNVRELAPC